MSMALITPPMTTVANGRCTSAPMPVLSAIGIVVTLFQIDYIRDQIEDDNPSFTSSEVDSAVAVGIGFAVVIGLIGVGLWLWMASANGQGKSWARIVATVLGALNVVGAIFSLAVTPATAVSAVLTIVSLILAVVILVLLYLVFGGTPEDAEVNGEDLADLLGRVAV